MGTRADTVESTGDDERPGGPAASIGGVVLAFSSGRPLMVPLKVSGGSLEIGRDLVARLAGADDDRMSRRHVRFELSAETGAWTVRDLESRNGTMVDGVRVEAPTHATPRCVRVGRSIFLPVRDVRPFEGAASPGEDGAVAGPTLRAAWKKITAAAAYADALLVVGESGAGKEIAARTFHGAATPGGPFVAVNCAAIPEGLAERLLFGARKGAYSGADADADGYLKAADGGTLFLDEIAELDKVVQGKLLRVLETKEILVLGASKPTRVALRVVSATHKDLRAEVRGGRFREDLFFRIGRPEVRVPPLRERPEEIPWLVLRELEPMKPRLEAHVTLIEACLLRAWPGNVRELIAEVRRAAHDAAAEGAPAVDAKHLGDRAGAPLDGRSPEALRATGPVPSGAPPGPAAEAPTPEAVSDALRKHQGNVTRSAKALGLHRTQLRRFLAKHAIDPQSFGPAEDDDP